MSQDSYEQSLALKLFTVLARTHNTLMELDRRDIRRYGLNQTEFAVLELLYHKGPHPLQQIGEKILITSGSITYVINKLEKKGLLERKPCEEDRRIVYATLTEHGKALLAEIFPQHAETLTKAFQGLTVEEKQFAIDLVKKIGLWAESH
ncbi:MarR family winged helix-turn-helix transcriptional regulator [Sporomusa malonica]|uniref:MarR family transcriptional regulator, 2-MHQ and catechol-resistance regulon repressor n=1 Tax=Sporomusa malonica TaxID=112901 RepID=A0A1W2BNW8_9FIRM|nr:MarR family transcriptional regulator [Sporomusa malonica]SMC74208.1 MarR family transcriptional regulator, 2-MHQ and catechol-resistance regulon repressor [Sporomusa malonica]